MKNIYVLPTDKPSRLHNKNGELGNYPSTKLYIEDFKGNQHNSFHIYITNSDEIKEGHWLDLSDNSIIKVSKEDLKLFKSYDKLQFKKIILTTDSDLIKDGVQAIDDEFLEWFVKNSSCESVEVEKTFVTNSGLGYQEYAVLDSNFKVIEINAKIPQTSYYLGKVTILNTYEYVITYKIIIPNLEIWKDIPDFEGYYQVSNLGNIKSLSRTILGKNNVPTLLKEKILKFSTSTNGYCQVVLNKNSDRKIFKVHSLVAICFLNHIPDGTHNIVIDHINEVKTDNRVENLRLIGHRENVARSIKNSTSTYVGVSWSKNAKKWISQITIDGKTKYLGLFDNEEDANKKYLETLKDL
jgi:hypothetical protein